MSDEARYSLTVAGPPAAQYEKGPMITIRGDSADELFDNAEAFFGREVADDLLSIFDLGRAVSVVKGKLDAEEPAPRKRGNRGAKKSKPQNNSGNDNFGVCPDCGDGQVIKRFRKDGTGHFYACDQFPDCRYIRNTATIEDEEDE